MQSSLLTKNIDRRDKTFSYEGRSSCRPFHGFVNFSHHGISQRNSVDTIEKSALKLVKVPNLKVINDLTF